MNIDTKLYTGNNDESFFIVLGGLIKFKGLTNAVMK